MYTDAASLSFSISYSAPVCVSATLCLTGGSVPVGDVGVSGGNGDDSSDI